MKYSLIILAGLLCASWAPPPTPSFCGTDSLCTLFARNNGGSFGGAVYFDVTAASDVDICGFDFNTAETTAAGLEVWTTPGTYVGNETNPAVWTQVAVDDGTGVGMGADIPTPITLASPFTLPTGSWGMALVAVGVGHDYTSGGASSTLQYTDGTLTIDLGAASNVPFTGGIFSPRLWNGCIHYTKVPTLLEDFDSYTPGALEGNTHPAGPTWHGWGGTNTFVSQVTTAMASSAPNSALLPIGTDSVFDMDDLTSGNPMVAGQWRLTAEIYVTGDYDGQTYFIVMNEYTDPGPYEWGVQVSMDAVNGNMTCDCGTGLITAPLIVDQWVDLRWDIDLDGDNVDYFYNGTLIGSYAWSGGPFGGTPYANLKVDSIDLFPAVAETAGQVYVDNIMVRDIPATGSAYCSGDGNYHPCPCGNTNDGSMSGCDWMGGNVAGGALGVTGTNLYADSHTFLQATNVSDDFGVFFSANGQVTGRTLGDGLRCAGHGLIRMTPPTMASGGTATHAMPLQTLDWGAGVGVTRYYQYWFRTDPGQCGSLANTTNGLEIMWM